MQEQLIHTLEEENKQLLHQTNKLLEQVCTYLYVCIYINCVPFFKLESRAVSKDITNQRPVPRG